VGVEFEFIDIGGGFGVPYRPEEEELNIEALARKLADLYLKRVKEYGLGEPTLYVEPGRYIVCDAGLLLTRVNTVKVTPFRRFLGVDAGFNTLIRPAMYGSYHPIVVANRLDEPEEETYTVVGPICESGDILAKDRRLPKVQEGDLIAVLNAGAYGYSMSSQYNSRPRCAEVLVKDGEYALIRERETFSSLFARRTNPQIMFIIPSMPAAITTSSGVSRSLTSGSPGTSKRWNRYWAAAKTERVPIMIISPLIESPILFAKEKTRALSSSMVSSIRLRSFMEGMYGSRTAGSFFSLLSRERGISDQTSLLFLEIMLRIPDMKKIRLTAIMRFGTFSPKIFVMGREISPSMSM